jgi:hypothetical protein
MAEQAKALRLADAIESAEYPDDHDVAAELRRQHAEIERLGNLCYYYIGQLTALRAVKQMQRRIDELKEKNSAA